MAPEGSRIRVVLFRSKLDQSRHERKDRSLYYKVLVPKSEITDRETLWNKAKDLANRSAWYWAYRDDEVVYAFESVNVATVFTIYCTNQRIRFQLERPRS